MAVVSLNYIQKAAAVAGFWRGIKERKRKNLLYLLQPGAGTIRPEIISSLITGGSDGGGGHTNDSIMSSVDRITPIRSGGSVRDDLLAKNSTLVH